MCVGLYKYGRTVWRLYEESDYQTICAAVLESENVAN